MYPKLINDPRLTPDLVRTRMGVTQGFRYPDEKSFEPSITIEPPERHIYAELIDGKWFWVNGCDKCNGEDVAYCYKRCVEHDVCVTCKTPRSKLKEIPWGVRSGIQCKPCAEKEHEIEKERALAAVEINGYDPWDFKNQDELRCPYCDYEFEDSHEMYSDSETSTECPRCDHKFNYVCEPRIYWSMSRTGD